MTAVKRRKIVEDMTAGYSSIEEILAGMDLKAPQLAMLAQLKESVEHYKKYLELSLSRFQRFPDFDFSAKAFKPLALRPNALVDSGAYGLTDEQVHAFQRDGMIGPFELLTESEAEALYEKLYDLNETGFREHFLLGDKAKKAVEASGWRINHSGIHQVINYPILWELACSPKITDKLAALLGPELLLWRSQFFEKLPKNTGTFWHQASTFRELAHKGKLTPPAHVDDNMTQISVWIALSDFDVNEGAMRFLLKSFNDTRLDHYNYYYQDQFFDIMAQKSQAVVEDALKILLFTNGIFEKSHYVFDRLVDRCPDMFEDYSLKEAVIKKGQFIIFTSSNIHGAHCNQSDERKLALGFRYTTPDVKVYDQVPFFRLPTPMGPINCPVEKLPCMLARGQDSVGVNHVITQPLLS